MVKKGLIAAFVLLFSTTVFSYWTGTMSNNVVATTTKGETIDFYSKLDAGMHVLVFATSAT